MRTDYFEEKTGLRLFGIYDTSRHTASDPNRSHLHAEAEIALVTDGRAEYSLCGKRFRVDANDVIFVPPNAAHSASVSENEELKTLTIRFSPYYLWGICREFIGEDKIAALLGGAIRGLTDSERVAARFNELADVFRRGERFAVKLAALNLVVALCVTVDSCERSQSPKPLHVEQIGKAIEFIGRNFADRVSLADAAKSAGMSRTRFADAFKAVTGVTPHDYLLIVRVKNAEKLLGDNYSITEIAYESGFNNVASFNKAFKKKNGVTPSEFRKTLR